MKKILFVFTAVLFFALALSSCKKDDVNNNENSGSNGNTGGNTTAVYVDLGLPSGTKWKSANEYSNGSGHYTFDEAVNTFGNNLPTKDQWNELIAYGTWSKQENKSYKVTGQNGNEIVLPAAGMLLEDGTMYDVGAVGHYWSSLSEDDEVAWCIYYSSYGPDWVTFPKYLGLSVRLVQN